MANKTLTRIDPNMVERIILSLHESGREKRTTISRNAKMSYDKCVKYLDYLEKINFVKKEVNKENYVMYGLSLDGINLCKNKISQKSELNNFDTDKNVLSCLFL